MTRYTNRPGNNQIKCSVEVFGRVVAQRGPYGDSEHPMTEIDVGGTDLCQGGRTGGEAFRYLGLGSINHISARITC
jgi:hypothetical protein